MRLLTHGGIFVLLLSTRAVGQLPPDPALKRAVDAREAALAVGDGETWGRLAQADEHALYDLRSVARRRARPAASAALNSAGPVCASALISPCAAGWHTAAALC